MPNDTVQFLLTKYLFCNHKVFVELIKGLNIMDFPLLLIVIKLNYLLFLKLLNLLTILIKL